MKRDFKITALFFALLPIIPIWYFDYLPLQDYPNHLARLTICSLYEHSDFYRNYFKIDFFNSVSPLPYITLDLFVNRLFSFIEIEKAMRLFITLYIVFYVLSLYLLSRRLRLDLSFLLLINIPLIYSWFFFTGLLNFIFSIPLFLFSVWAIERYDANRNISNIFLIGLFSIFIYFTHIFTFLIFLVFLSCYLLVRKLKARESILLLASVSLSLFFSINSGLVDIPVNTMNSLLDKFKGLFMLFFYLPNSLIIINSVLFVATIIIILRNSFIYNKLYFISSIALLLIYLILPQEMNGYRSDLDMRVLFFSFMLLPLSLQIQYNGYVELAKFILIVVILISFSWSLISFTDFNKNFSTVCAGQLENRTFVLPVDATQHETDILTPYLHSWGYFLKYKEVLSPYLFQHNHIPIKYRDRPPAPSEFWVTHENKEISPKLMGEISDTYDYILLIGNDPKVEDLIGSISYQVCSDRLVSLYKVEKGENR